MLPISSSHTMCEILRDDANLCGTLSYTMLCYADRGYFPSFVPIQYAITPPLNRFTCQAVLLLFESHIAHRNNSRIGSSVSHRKGASTSQVPPTGCTLRQSHRQQARRVGERLLRYGGSTICERCAFSTKGVISLPVKDEPL